MELVNATPIPAWLGCSIADESERFAMLVAKATFAWGTGVVHLEAQNPCRILSGDVETELGILPNDLVPRVDPPFEVILLGAAYAPGAQPVGRRLVALTVGSVRRELLVTGDRKWE